MVPVTLRAPRPRRRRGATRRGPRRQGASVGEGSQDRRREALLEQLRRAAGGPLSLRELMQRAGLHPGERTEAKRALRDLAKDGTVVRDGKRFALPAAREA